MYSNPEANAYPISAYSYLVAPCNPALAAAQHFNCTGPQGSSTYPSDKGSELGQFVSFLACAGQVKMAELGYSPLPTNLVQEDFDAVGRLTGGRQPPPPTPATCQNPDVTGVLKNIGGPTITQSAQDAGASNATQAANSLNSASAASGTGGGTSGSGGSSSGGSNGGTTVGGRHVATRPLTPQFGRLSALQISASALSSLSWGPMGVAGGAGPDPVRAPVGLPDDEKETSGRRPGVSRHGRSRPPATR